jgi:hypothetical protein
LQGCGYPPDVDCDMYAEKYENYSLVSYIYAQYKFSLLIKNNFLVTYVEYICELLASTICVVSTDGISCNKLLPADINIITS